MDVWGEDQVCLELGRKKPAGQPESNFRFRCYRTPYSAQQGHAATQQTCLAHLARDVAYALEASDDPVPFRLKLWLASAFELADDMAHLAASTVAAKQRALERRLAAILSAPTTCDLACALQAKLRRARDQLLTFAACIGRSKSRPLRRRKYRPRRRSLA